MLNHSLVYFSLFLTKFLSPITIAQTGNFHSPSQRIILKEKKVRNSAKICNANYSDLEMAEVKPVKEKHVNNHI